MKNSKNYFSKVRLRAFSPAARADYWPISTRVATLGSGVARLDIPAGLLVLAFFKANFLRSGWAAAGRSTLLSPPSPFAPPR